MRKIYIAVISVVTVICVIIGAANYFNDGVFWGKDEYCEYSVSESDGGSGLARFDSISAQVGIMDVTVAAGDEFRLEYKVPAKSKPEIYVENGTLVVEQKGQRERWFSLGNGFKEHWLVLTVPEENALNMVDVVSNVGDVSLSGISARDVKADCDVGDVKMEACVCDAVFVESEVGNIDLKGCGLGDFFAGTDTGDINVQDCEAAPAQFESDTGDICVERCELGDVTVSSDVGDVGVEDCVFGNVVIEAETGDVKVVAREGLDEYGLELITDVGSVEVGGERVKKKYMREGSGRFWIRVSTDIGGIVVGD